MDDQSNNLTSPLHQPGQNGPAEEHIDREGQVVILIVEQKNADKMEKLPADYLWISFEPGTNNWSFWTKVKFAVSAVIFIVTLTLTVVDYYQRPKDTDDATGDSDCSTSYNNGFAAKMIVSCVSLARHVVPCFRQYWFHQTHYEWPFMTFVTRQYGQFYLTVLEYRYESGNTGSCNPFCCHCWYTKSSITALWNLITVGIYIGAVVWAIDGANRASHGSAWNVCQTQNNLDAAYDLYVIAAFMSTMSFSAMLLRFSFECCNF